MEWIERLNKAINYIEENITKEIEYEQLAKIACCSTYHFQRMFAYMADVPLSEYIRRRRMSLAAVELQNDNKKIIDIALKYGYSSPTAFNRAFKSIHGIAPSIIKKEETINLKAFPPISFKITIKGAEEMNYRIEKKEAFRIVGVSQRLHTELEKNFEIVPKMWQQSALDGTIQKLLPMMNSQLKGVLGVSVCNDSEEWKYFISVASTASIDDTLDEYTIPPFTWAIFSGEGQCPQAIQELEKRIVTEWLPTSGYEYENGPDIELYLNPDPQNAKFEVWIPVIKK
ncbi:MULTISPECIES: AraC family transcriptional regulator [unclassified Clostridioides]|uniref:AraC family transcriptional regulator n=1 Tax=unclassified Clostridioides TaxID=2635829 RepID=UPI001D129876|nr:AraC family transcriptional regulator [Clostridioides sp. ZZV15-6388]MCC0643199.1 AraC family transcriptional regulator [Clostridioides sp. ZZV14-6150]MCC0658970.1 AraC family transcriptional regulator [Clostridioides sp. ZZV14-6154]MCC0670345.1 AraC family transcriptional regulator [Clostridioides sp. ZZV14-6153]MCC0723644.1 AraC family transcriptional regulator [Clostridioides sp. ZZV14-6104]MCC0738611.1 AraC family transcriptional regulator [Clostridioides sp. ZZV14-5902]MCC0741535.1 Ar